jgi:hypothetical protein
MLSSKLVERLEQAAVASSCPLTTLTNPSAGVGNDGYDNELNDLILTVDDVLVSNNRRCDTDEACLADVNSRCASDGCMHTNARAAGCFAGTG